MKKSISIILATLILISIIPMFAFAENDTSMKVEVKAKSCILMEASSGKILMADKEHDKVYPASITKIMTLLLVTEAIDEGKISLTDMVTTSTNSSKKGGSQIWLKENEQMSVDDLLKATAVYSANDACTSLAEYIGGSDIAFVKLMNDKAKALEMNDTNFENCTGLDDTAENHYTSAHDIAVMSRELLKHQRIINYTTIWMDSLRGGQTELVNTNKLIRFYNGATGLKTGTTSKAGKCLSATAVRDGLSLIAVVMGSESSDDRFNGAKALLDWGFANYSAVKPEIDKSLIANVNVINGYNDCITPVIPDTKSIILEKGKENELRQVVDMPIDVEAPVEENQILGTVTFYNGDEKVSVYNLTAGEKVIKLTFFEQFRRCISALCR